MGFNATFAVLHDLTVDDLPVTGAALTFDEVSTSVATELTAAQVGDRVLLLDPDFGERAKPLAAARGARIELVVLHSLTDTYIVEAVAPDGEPTRRRIEVEGEVVQEFGDPLPAETAAAGADDAEDAHLATLQSLVGVSLEDLMAVRFVAVDGSTA